MMAAIDQAVLLSAARQVFPGGALATFLVDDEVAFVADHGSGAKLWDVAGHEYLDFVLGSGPMILGHAHPAVLEAVESQIRRGSQFNWITESAVGLAQMLVDAIPCADMVKFASSGAEATFYALRLARSFTGRSGVVRFNAGYHGHHDYGMWGKTAGIPEDVGATVYSADFNGLEETVKLIEQHARDIAAVIVEPVIRVVPPEPGFLEGLREVTSALGIILIFDEVVTGFRIGWGRGARTIRRNSRFGLLRQDRWRWLPARGGGRTAGTS